MRVYQFRHLGEFRISRMSMSGKRDSDPRPRPWQGRALPTELLPQPLNWSVKCISLNASAKVALFFQTAKTLLAFFSKILKKTSLLYLHLIIIYNGLGFKCCYMGVAASPNFVVPVSNAGIIGSIRPPSILNMYILFSWVDECWQLSAVLLSAVSSSALSCQQFCSQLSANSNSRVSRLQISFFSSPLARLVLHDIPTTRQFLACLSKMCCSSDPVKDIRASLRKDKSQSVSCLQSVNIHKHEVSSDSRLVSIQSKPIAYWYADQ